MYLSPFTRKIKQMVHIGKVALSESEGFKPNCLISAASVSLFVYRTGTVAGLGGYRLLPPFVCAPPLLAKG